MIKCTEIISFMERIAPGELAENWDNIGLLVGNREKNIRKILICLDITMASIDEAISQNADLIISHHPVIFDELKRLNDEDFKGKQLYKLIRNGLNVYSAHTNLDYATPGVNSCLAETLEIYNAVIMGRGPGICGMLDEKMGFDEFINHVKSKLQVPFLRAIGHNPAEIRKVAVFSGSFDGDLKSLIESGAEALVTGDLKYHTALDAREAGLCIIDAGHFSTESVVLPYLARKLGEQYPDVEILLCRSEIDPFTYR